MWPNDHNSTLRKVIGDKMKKRIGNAICIQKYDLYKITTELSSVPSSFAEEAKNQVVYYHLCDEHDMQQFSCAFRRPENIQWLMEQDWILDYDQCNKKSVQELRALREKFKGSMEAEIEAMSKYAPHYHTNFLAEEADFYFKEYHRLQSLDWLISVKKSKPALASRCLHHSHHSTVDIFRSKHGLFIKMLRL